ncbi:MAG: fumarylacetoacetate hydrolase family protein [Gemmatimonadota bacterium]
MKQRSMVPSLFFVLVLALAACGDVDAGPAADYAVAAPQEGVTHHVRFEVDGQAHYGILEGETIRELSGPPYNDPPETGRSHDLASVRLLAPVEPRAVLAVGLNYGTFVGEDAPPEAPLFFAKLPGTIIGTEGDIHSYPAQERLFYETELVVVIGRTASNITAEEAPDYIFGVAAGNDVSDRGWQTADEQWFRGKSADTWGPVGPVVARGLDYGNLEMVGRLNGEEVQRTNSADLIFDIPTLVAYITQWITLHPGDVIFSGTPGGAGELQPGDVFEVEVEGVGTLRNTVVSVGDAAVARGGG